MEIIRKIVDISDEADSVAALSLCNQDLQSILENVGDPGSIAYVAICSLEINLVRMTLRKYRGKAMRAGLTKLTNDVYALDLVAQQNRRDIFNIMEPYITYGHSSTHEAVMSAIGHKHYSLVKRLIPYLSDVSILAAFEQLCNAGDHAFVDSIIFHLPISLWTAACSSNLESAVTSGRIDLVRVLISGTADLDTIMVSEQLDSEKRTCLHWLGIYGLWTNEMNHAVGPMVRMLCEAGANVNALDYQGRSALHHFALSGSRAVTPFLEFPDDFTNERLDWIYECVLQAIINANANIDQQDEFGKTPLHLAVERQEWVMIQVLMKAGANALIRDNEGTRASMTAGARVGMTNGPLTWGFTLSSS